LPFVFLTVLADDQQQGIQRPKPVKADRYQDAATPETEAPESPCPSMEMHSWSEEGSVVEMDAQPDQIRRPPGLTLDTSEKPDPSPTHDFSSVSILQEFVQGRSEFLPHQKILSWSYEEQCTGESADVFRASVSFVMDGVSKTYCGGWAPSKKKAQRDTAEKVLWFLRSEGAPEPQVLPTPSAASASGARNPDGPIAELHCYVREQSGLSSNEKVLHWEYEGRTEPDSGSGGVPCFRATVSFTIAGARRSLCGGWHASKKKAQRDTAERVLIYLRSAPCHAESITAISFCPSLQPVMPPVAPHLWATDAHISPLSSPAFAMGVAEAISLHSALSWDGGDDVFAVLAGRFRHQGQASAY